MHPIGAATTCSNKLAQRAGIGWNEGIQEFAIELALAHDAGYLTWTDRGSQYSGRFSPTNDSNMWLQSIDDITLTLAGRDRARGRIIQVALPDAEEDDGRIITGLTLEEIARSMGDAYTAAQLPRYLRDSGIPAELVPPSVAGDKWAYVLNILSGLHEGGSAARRSLREFIGVGWTDATMLRRRQMCGSVSLRCLVSRAGMSAMAASPSENACTSKPAL